MITADKLALLSNIPTYMLTTLIRETGYKEDSFITSKFLGLTNGREFCYAATYKGDDGDAVTTKVFVTYTASTDSITAAY